MKLLLLTKKIVVLIVMSILVFLVLWFIFMIVLFVTTPSREIKDLSREQTLDLINKSINISANEIQEIIFSQMLTFTFLGDSWCNSVIKLTKEWTTKLISNNTKIWNFEYKEISSLRKCNLTDNNNNKKINIPSDFQSWKYYYVTNSTDYTWWTTIFIDDKNNIMYFCSYNN